MSSISGTMNAIVFKSPGGPEVLELINAPIPALETPYDVLVKVTASALNPADIIVRQGHFPSHPIMGYDACGSVVQRGASALFHEGDKIIWSGAAGRAGSNAQYAVVDSRIAGPQPAGWSDADAAGLPLVALTAWEMFEGHFNLEPFSTPKREHTLLIINGAGGVGSIATQLARNVFGIKNVVVTASRKETVEWVKRKGATHTINHREPLKPQLDALGLVPSLVFVCYDNKPYIKQIIELVSPWARIGLTVAASEPLGFESPDAFGKALSFHWEFMFGKTVHKYDMETQGRMLGDLKKAAEQGLVTSLTTHKEVLSVDSLRRMHALQESGQVIGKIVFEVGDSIE